MTWDTEERLVYCGVGAFLLIVALVVGATALDSLQDYRSFPQRTACELRQMQPRRQTFSAHIICVPMPMRRDTLALERGK